VAEFGLSWRAGWDIAVSVIGTDGILRLGFNDANDPQQPTVLEVTGEPPREFATDTYLEAWKTFHHCVLSRSRPRYDAELGAADVNLAWELVRHGTP
jgi:predicted dehydrogenase